MFNLSNNEVCISNINLNISYRTIKSNSKLAKRFESIINLLFKTYQNCFKFGFLKFDNNDMLIDKRFKNSFFHHILINKVEQMPIFLEYHHTNYQMAIENKM